MANAAFKPEVLYSISQVNALTGVPKSTIRFWEKEFKEFLVPVRTAGNQRRYSPEAVSVVEKINRLVNGEGYTLEGARRKLRNGDGRQETPGEDPGTRLNQLAETMSDYLLQKLFERVRADEAQHSKGLGLGQ